MVRRCRNVLFLSARLVRNRERAAFNGESGTLSPVPDNEAEGCPFCNPDQAAILLANDYARAVPDAFPVTPGHTLIVPKRHVVSIFETTRDEQMALFDLLAQARELLLQAHHPEGFNIGINDGTAAGQTVLHLHIHLIPRYAGDTADPRGGVRWIMPEQAPYWKRHR